ncbi:sterile alpha motif-like domain-containing protein [Lysinibacillus sp. ZYM-1]|uniref:sterile alpha motif-like domain-containing protein n=1 Tax=Lysinibacillus sp. ZYM-1 TaxID=1681184 RepID=UPI0006CE6D51|nr:sterile alpha motif-like domain-containing protein [Lysinibacillus sp. ZYM-1]KPN97744.1 hypothetical protein AO843_11280 [Lysinibacillus sp. ZYM-1]
MEAQQKIKLSKISIDGGKTMIFKTWIQQFINEDNPIGDLARDNEQDPSFPDSNSYNELYDYLYSQNASELCLLSFDKAWQLYNARQRKCVGY